MINLTVQYPNTVFLPVGSTQLQARINLINTTGINTLAFPKKYRRANIGLAPDGSGARASQIDALIGNSTTYAFQSLADAKTYALEAASQMVNNATAYVENIQSGYYQIMIWSK